MAEITRFRRPGTRLDAAIRNAEADQRSGKETCCPRCGRGDLRTDPDARQSWHTGLTICGACAAQEAELREMNMNSVWPPIYNWAVFKRQRPEGDFRAVPIMEAREIIDATMMGQMRGLFEQRLHGLKGDEFKFAAYATLKGLTDVKTDPQVVFSYACGNGTLTYTLVLDAYGEIWEQAAYSETPDDPEE